MEMVWVFTPRLFSSSSIFMAVVVLPEPEGPESSTMGLRARLSWIMSAALRTFSSYSASQASKKPLTSWSIWWLISWSW